MSVKERDPLTGHQTTGHEWNGITELNTGVPKVIWWFIAVTHLYALIAWILLPTWPLVTTYTKGLLGLDQKSAVAAQIRAAAEQKSVWTDKIATMGFDRIQADPALMRVVNETAPELFGDNCAACHGVNASGGPGFPSLVDSAWLWGGAPETIFETLRVGINSLHPDTRVSQMLAFGRDGMLSRDQIRLVADYVQSLSGTEGDPERVQAGAEIFAENCTSCHGEDARGSQDIGAPDLTDRNWIYGGDDQTLFRTIYGGRQGWMPSWQDRLSDVDRKILTLYLAEKEVPTDDGS